MVYNSRDLGGNVTERKDPRGETTYFTYNSAGWPTTSSVPSSVPGSVPGTEVRYKCNSAKLLEN